jgi:hypothetical protein
MRRMYLIFGFLLAVAITHASAFAQTSASGSGSGWKAKVVESMPLLGHRNWILVVDSAYPLQVSPGLETVETNAGQIEVTQYVLEAIGKSVHVRPNIFMDSELPFVPEDDAPGVARYRSEIGSLLHEYKIQSEPHEKLLSDIDHAGKAYHVLILKTRLAIPYTSVFFQLDCRYWSADAEKRLRAQMAAHP